MSVRAELVRLGLRWLLKSRNDPSVPLAERRARLARFERWVPRPPADADIRRCEIGGVAAPRIVVPGSRPDRCRRRSSQCRRGPISR